MALVLKAYEGAPQTDRRRSQRRKLCVDAQVQVAGGGVASVVAQELSTCGFLLEGTVSLSVGEVFEIRLSTEHTYRARSIWTCGALVGCEFAHRIRSSELSAVLLQSRPRRQSDQLSPEFRIENSYAVDGMVANGHAGRRGSLSVLGILSLCAGLWSLLAVGIYLL